MLQLAMECAYQWAVTRWASWEPPPQAAGEEVKKSGEDEHHGEDDHDDHHAGVYVWVIIAASAGSC